MEIIRLLLQQQETSEANEDLKQYAEEIVMYHIALMLDAGLIEGYIHRDNGGKPIGASIVRMTWAGHEFLDSTRDLSIWNKAKEKVLNPGISWTFSMLTEFLKAEAQRRLCSALGLPPSP